MFPAGPNTDVFSGGGENPSAGDAIAHGTQTPLYQFNRNSGQQFDQWGRAIGQQNNYANQYLKSIQSPLGSVAQQQMRSGLGQAQRTMQAQALGRGANPANERAAMYAGAGAATNTIGAAGALRAQEEQQARQMQMQAAQFGAQQYAAQTAFRQSQAEAARAAAEKAWELQNGVDQQNSQQAGNVAAGIGSALGGAAMMFSDRDLKENVAPAGANLDSTLRAVGSGQAGAQPPSFADKDAAYQQWLRANGRQNERDYDWRGLYRENGPIDVHAGGPHVTDRYKLPNHETFSDESMYSTAEHPGGHWVGDRYVPEARWYQQPARLESDLNRLDAGTSAELRRNIPGAAAEDTVRNAPPSTFTYTPAAQASGAPSGVAVSGMAQDLQRTPLGRQMVVDTPIGKVVDRNKMTGLTLAASARNTQRIDQHAQRLDAIERGLTGAGAVAGGIGRAFGAGAGTGAPWASPGDAHLDHIANGGGASPPPMNVENDEGRYYGRLPEFNGPPGGGPVHAMINVLPQRASEFKAGPNGAEHYMTTTDTGEPATWQRDPKPLTEEQRRGLAPRDELNPEDELSSNELEALRHPGGSAQ